MRYQTKTRKAGYGEYFVTVVDTENKKPTVTVKLENMGWSEGSNGETQWKMGDPVERWGKTDYDFDHCMGYRTKKDVIWWLQRDGAHIDENTVIDKADSASSEG